MAGVNKVIVVGNLGNDPDHKKFDNGGSVTNISVATSERWTDKQTGEQRELTEWHRIVFSNRLAEIAAQYLRKGSKVYVEGSLRTKKWQDQNGQDRYTTEIRAQTMQMLDSRGGDTGMGGGQNYQSAPPAQPYQQQSQQNQQPVNNTPAAQNTGFAASPQAASVEDDDLPF